jgi:hypothetical protein
MVEQVPHTGDTPADRERLKQMADRAVKRDALIGLRDVCGWAVAHFVAIVSQSELSMTQASPVICRWYG